MYILTRSDLRPQKVIMINLVSTKFSMHKPKKCTLFSSFSRIWKMNNLVKYILTYICYKKFRVQISIYGFILDMRITLAMNSLPHSSYYYFFRV